MPSNPSRYEEAKADLRYRRIVSPEILQDGRVLFRLLAPNAHEVKISGKFLTDAIPMFKDSHGVWSAIAGPLEPGIYEYAFEVDGTAMPDPSNRDIKPTHRPRSSILAVAGNPPLIYDFRNLPHGTVHRHFYYSDEIRGVCSFLVYTPPGYDGTADRYPSLYLLAGSGDTEDAWIGLGRANLILDNLIASKSSVPMILVLLDGDIRRTTYSIRKRQSSTDMVSSELLHCVMPLVSRCYRVLNAPEHRAILGVSKGGGQALMIGLAHPDLFGWICGLSSAVFERRELSRRRFPARVTQQRKAKEFG